MINFPTPSNPSPHKGGLLANLRVAWKLNLLIFVMGFGLLAIFVTAIVNMRSMRAQVSNLYDYMLVPLSRLESTSVSLAEIHIILDTLEQPGISPQQMETGVRNIKSRETVIGSTINLYESRWITSTSPEISLLLQKYGREDLQQNEKYALAKLKESFSKYLTASDEFQKALTSGHYNEELAKSMVSALDETSNNMDRLSRINNDIASVAKLSASDSYSRFLKFMNTVLVIAILLSAILAIAIPQTMVRRLNILNNAAANIEKGMIDSRVNLPGSDELSTLAKTFNHMAEKLSETLANMEHRIEERTRELQTASAYNERRAHQFAAVTQVMRAINSSQSIQDLLPQITKVISDQFGFYHVGIFLVDSNNEYAILSAANSEGGQRMLQRKHKLKVGETGIVGTVAGAGLARVALDTGTEAVFFNNPDLPDTRSEMALPLFSSDRKVVGVLDVQSTEANAFGQDDIAVISTLAEQVSLAIANSILFEETRRSVREAELVYRRSMHAGWSRFARANQTAGIQRSGNKSTILKEPLKNPEMEETLKSGETRQVMDSSNGGSSQLTIPVKLRGEIIGVLNVQSNETRTWTQDELDVVTAIVERAALSVENARLLSESRKLADKERAISEIAAKISTHSSRENILQAAVSEIGRMMPGAEVMIQFQSKDAPN